jgi:O-antigen/teichoic acid export membrane protein
MQTPPAAPTAPPKSRLGTNAATQMGARALYMLTRLVVPPAVLSHVSLEEYGIWSICFIVISYLGMSAFGISNVYIRQVARYQAQGKLEKVNQLLSTGLVLTVPLVGALFALLWWMVPVVVASFGVSPALADTASFLILGTASVFCLDLTFGAFAYVMHGMQLIARHTAIWTLSFLAEIGLILILLQAGYGIQSLLIAFVARYLLSISLSAVACFRALPGLSIAPRHFRRELIGQFTGFGAVVQLTGVLSIFLNSIEKLVAGAFLGVQATGLFEVGQKLPIMSSQVTASMNAVFLPAAAHLHSSAQKERLLSLYLRGSRYVSLINGYAMGFLAAFAPLLLYVWIGGEMDLSRAAFLMALFTLPNQLNVLTGPGSALHRGAGQPLRELRYPLAQMALAVLGLGSAWLWDGLSVESIALAIAGAMSVSALFYMGMTNRILDVELSLFVRKVLLPGLLPYFIGFGLRYLIFPGQWPEVTRWYLGLILVACGLAYTMLNAVAFWVFSCEKDEKRRMIEQLNRLLSRLSLGSFGGAAA